MSNLMNAHFLMALVVVGPLLIWGVWILSEESFDELNSRYTSSHLSLNAHPYASNHPSASTYPSISNHPSASTYPSISNHRSQNRMKEDFEKNKDVAKRRVASFEMSWLTSIAQKIFGESDLNSRGARHTRQKFLPMLFLAIFVGIVFIALIFSNASKVIPNLLVPVTLGISLVAYLKRNSKKEIDQISKVMEDEMPVQIQLLTILVSSGMSPARAISKLAQRSDSVSSLAFKKVVERIGDGYSVVEALDEMKSNYSSNSLRRFVTSLILGIERGSSLSPILTAQVRDARLARKTEIMQNAGKAEIRLMIPVVFLILPISILFALWPSYEQLGAFL